ncbi:hypothetical protein L0P88_10285 [Muricauda sp. SCSIO 64092]|uniref:Piwi domain-containing protein n=1 Tax=Allomuricauda sp. SCSIO 64092 TaxID=2908842 RepID=UPI001FF60F98|nr:Piwi domain-containing protein [Muricauda sp. SCSIO 64092]UOY08921.1 hypothetical protein L0P88_10285 [Muricauda sp. SCSIO 64092]
MEEIKLNFINLLNEEGTIQLFRTEYNQQAIEEEALHVYSLVPKDNEEYQKFIVSFDNREGFEEYTCSIWENVELTKRWLSTLLRNKLETIEDDSLTFNIRRKRFETSFDFILNETDYGNQVINVAPYYLKAKKQFGFLIDFRFRKKQGLAFNKEVQRLSLSLDKNYRSNKNYYADKYQKIRGFIDYKLKDLLVFRTEMDELKFNNDLVNLTANKLEKKQYVFGNGKIGFSQFQGVKNYGPYRSVDSDITYLFIFEDSFKSFANDIYLSLIGKTNPGTFPGMSEMFGLPLSKENVKRVPIKEISLDSLKESISKILDYKKKHIEKRIIAILLEESSEDNNPETDSPYYYLKYNLLRENVPVQVLSKERVGSQYSLKWSTSNIGLQIFSKLGGVPWLVKPSNHDCLILGIGSSHKYDESTGKIHKYLAYSICLDSSGIYKKLSILSESEDEQSYLEELKKNLMSLLEQEFTEYRKVVLHVPFKIKQKEIDSMDEALSQFKDVDFKVIKINTDNKFFGFSRHNTQVPYESSYIKLAKNEYLVWFEGLQYGKEIVFQRISNPVHIKFLNSKSTSKAEDKTYLQDVLNLSGANWRGFNAKSIPISVYYSKIIAEYTKAFEGFDGFEKGIFSTNKPWFL